MAPIKITTQTGQNNQHLSGMELLTLPTESIPLCETREKPSKPTDGVYGITGQQVTTKYLRMRQYIENARQMLASG